MIVRITRPVFLGLFFMVCFGALAQPSVSEQEEMADKIRKANAKVEVHDFQGAIGMYSQIIVEHPELKEAHKNRGICYSIIRNLDSAIVDFDAALLIDPNDYSLWNYRGFSKAELNRFEEALVDINKSIELNGEYDEAYLNKGIVMMWLDRHDEAIALFNKVIELHPQNAKAYYNRGIAYEKLGNVAGACLDWSQAKRLNFPMAMQMLEQFCE